MPHGAWPALADGAKADPETDFASIARGVGAGGVVVHSTASRR